MPAIGGSELTCHNSVLGIFMAHPMQTEMCCNKELTRTSLALTKSADDFSTLEAFFPPGAAVPGDNAQYSVFAVSSSDQNLSCVSVLVKCETVKVGQSIVTPASIRLTQFCEVSNPKNVSNRNVENGKTETESMLYYHMAVIDALAKSPAMAMDRILVQYSNDAVSKALSSSAALGDFHLVSNLAESVCNVLNAVPDYFASAMLLAVENGHLPILKYFVEDHEVPSDSIDAHGNCALQIASMKGNHSIVNFILNQDVVDVNDDRYSLSPLYLAAQNGHHEICKTLLESGADVSFKAKNHAAFTPLLVAAFEGYEKIVELLLSSGADMECRSAENFTSLMVAAQHSHQKTVSLLVEKGAQLRARNRDGWTALMLAVYNGAPFETFSLLLRDKDTEFNVQARTRDGKTLLTLASYAGQLEVCHYALSNGADITLLNEDDITPLMAAAQNGHYETIKLLLTAKKVSEIIDHQCDQTLMTALMFAAEKGHKEIVSALLQNGAGIDVQDSSGWTALIYAIEHLQEETARLLIEAGTSVTHRALNGRPPLMFAAQHDLLSGLVKLLVERGAQVDAVDNDGVTSLLIASFRGNVAVTRVLLECGADVTVRDKLGCNCLVLAVRGGHVAVTESLLARKEVLDLINKCDCDGRTALQSAKLRGYKPIASLLIKHGAVDEP